MIVRRIRRASILLTFLLFGLWSIDMLTRPLTFTDVIIRSNPGVVEIKITPSAGSAKGLSRGLAGFIVSREGHILTAAHGFSKNNKTDKIEVHLWEDYKISYKANLIRLNRELDIALIQVLDLPKDVSVLRIGDALPGDKVIAIGHPRYFAYTANEGMVTGHRVYSGIHLLQFSSDLNPGNSGGPVLNQEGEVVGMAFYIVNQGISLAVPSEVLRAFTRNIPTRGPHAEMYEMSNAVKQALQNTGLLPGRVSENSKK